MRERVNRYTVISLNMLTPSLWYGKIRLRWKSEGLRDGCRAVLGEYSRNRRGCCRVGVNDIKARLGEGK